MGVYQKKHRDKSRHGCYSDLGLCLLPCDSVGNKSACNAGDLSSIPGLGRSPGEGKDNPLQYSGLDNSMDCIYIVYGIAKSRTSVLWEDNFF